MSPKPHNRSRPTMRGVGAKATTPSSESRERALANSIAAGQVRKNADRRVDWDAVIERFLKDMRRRAREERKTGAESDSERLSGTGTPDRPENRHSDDSGSGNHYQGMDAGAAE